MKGTYSAGIVLWHKQSEAIRGGGGGEGEGGRVRYGMIMREDAGEGVGMGAVTQRKMQKIIIN